MNNLLKTKGLMKMGTVLINPKMKAYMRRISSVAETASLILLVVCLLYQYSFNSTFCFFTWRGQSWLLQFGDILLYIMASIGGIKIGTSMLAAERWNRKLIPSFILSLLYIGAYYVTKNIFLLFFPVLTVTFIDTDYQKVVKVAVVTGLAFLVVSFIGVFGGIIYNYVFYRDGYLRSSWGFSYPTDMASFMLFTIGLAWIAWHNLPDEIILVGTAICFWISYKYAASRTSAACCVFFILIIIYHMVETRILLPKHCFRHFSIAFQKFVTYSFPLMALLYGLCLFLYAKGLPIGQRLNHLFSDRLAYTLRNWLEQGIHPFGSNFVIIGNGVSTTSPESANFLDCSYTLILIRYGWLLLLAICVLWCAMSYRARIKGDLRLLLMMSMIAVHAFSEQHFIEVTYNILLSLLFSSIPQSDNLSKSTDTSSALDLKGKNLRICTEPTLVSFWNKRKYELIASALVITLLFLIAPLQLSRIRTLLGILGYKSFSESLWQQYHKEQYLIILQILVLVFLISAPVFTVSDLILHHKENQRQKLFSTTILCVFCFASLLGIFIGEGDTISKSEDDFSLIMQADEEALNRIIAVSQGKVCIEGVPELYRKKYNTISRPILYGDDLARLKCSTILTDLGIDRQRFSEMGFSFSQISPYHGIYSNDPAVIKALSNAGFSWADYYNLSFDVDLRILAEMNGLELSSNGTIFLTSKDERLENGPHCDLYGGNYVLTANLKIPRNTTNHDGVVCNLKITAAEDEHLLQESIILSRDFDATGNLTYHTTFSIRKGGIRNVEFHVIPSDGQSIEIQHIQYQKVSLN